VSGCGSHTTIGHGESLVCGRLFCGQVYFCSACRIAALRAEVAELQQTVTRLEKLRPHWAQGFTSDGVAAQVTTNALQQLWDLLGVQDQTQAIQRLKLLLQLKDT
jgi:hypothetical protein